MKTLLGATYRDIITGLEGVCTGRCEYLTGCHQALIQPQAADKAGDGKWFDEQRLERVGETQIVLDNSATPGCDIPAPIR